MKKIYILDAVNYLFRSYYAIGPIFNDKGQSTNALYGFIRSLQKLIRDFSPEHLVCVFDGPDNKKQRQAVYAEYKMHRKGAPDDLFPQFEWAYKYCEMAGIPVLCVEGVEADDTMATIALWAEKQGSKVFLCSSDKDLMQLVNENIFMLQLHKDNLLIDSSKVEELFGVKPKQMLDLLAMMGDASDNIPGLPGIGPKTAASLLQEFGTLDEILKCPERIKGEKKQQLFRDHQKDALLSRELATLNTHVPIPEESEFYKLREIDREKVENLFREMNFNTLLKELPGAEANVKPLYITNRHTVDQMENVKELCHKLLSVKELGIVAIATDGHPMLAELKGIGFCQKTDNLLEIWYVPFQSAFIPIFRTFFDTAPCVFYGHNLKYEFHVLQNYNLTLRNISFDTLLASYLLNPQKKKHSLDELVLEKFQIVRQEEQLPFESLEHITSLKAIFSQELANHHFDSLFHTIEIPLISILGRMEREGIYLDIEQLAQVKEGLISDLNKIKEAIFQEIGTEFNLNSPKQILEILNSKLGIKTRSTSADVLEELASEHPIMQHILNYRTLEKLRSTYAEALPKSVNPHTHRIHCTFNQSVTATGRLSCQDPNLQNIPKHSLIRNCFKPKPQFLFLSADYSQIELRLLAHFSKDTELLRAFNSGVDVHIHTASLIFQVPEAEITPAMRSAAKTVNFGIIYGQSSFGLSKQLNISVGKAAEFIKTYFQRYPKVLEYLESCKQLAREKGYSLTITGRKRPIPEIHNKNPSVRHAAERLAINTPLQGTAADLIKMAMIAIDKEILHLQGKMILQIHDELIFEVPESEIPIFEALVKEKMEKVTQLEVPIEVNLAVGKNWAEC